MQIGIDISMKGKWCNPDWIIKKNWVKWYLTSQTQLENQSRSCWIQLNQSAAFSRLHHRF